MDKLNLSFIEGVFDTEDGQEILNYLFAKKITYHQNRLFDLDIKYSRDCQFSKMRIASLSDSRDQVNNAVREAVKQGKKLKVTSTIQLELVDAQEETVGSAPTESTSAQ